MRTAAIQLGSGTASPVWTTVGSPVLSTLQELWQTDRLLTATSMAMLVALGAFAAGLHVDPREVTDAPVWLKPAKFALSTGIYMLTVVWAYRYVPAWRRTRRVVSLVTATVFLIEVGLIALQAWRGVPSHFNVATTFDALVFRVMGVSIAVQTATSIALAVAFWRQRFADRALGWALRLGMVITILGASTGGLMARPTPAQIADANATGRLVVAGAHTVGAPDGGPGLPVTGWSTRGGDVRVAHFLGLHALQTLPLLAVFVRRRPEPSRVRTVFAAAGLYALIVAGVLVQALSGRPLVPLG